MRRTSLHRLAGLIPSITSLLLVTACSSATSTNGPSPSDRATASPTAIETPAPEESPPSLEEICLSSEIKARSMWLVASDGVRLYAVESGTGDTAVVLAHESGSDLCIWLSYMKTLNRAGIRTLAFDFRGYGESDYPADEHLLALGLDLAAAVDRVQADGAEHVFLLGASMGGAAVVQNSAGIRVDGLISLSGTRFPEGYGINDSAGVQSLSAPFLYVGSRQDVRTPVGQARSVFGRVGSRDKQIVLYPGGAHGITLVDTQPQTRALILRWIESRAAG